MQEGKNKVTAIICEFFGIRPGSKECQLFIAEFPDPVYVANTISVIIKHEDLDGVSRKPEKLDYIMLPIIMLGSMVPIIPAGGNDTKLMMENKATLCKIEGKDITITLRIAFSGADNSYISCAKNEIERVWNGPNGYQTYSKYRVKFKVETMKITQPPSSSQNLTFDQVKFEVETMKITNPGYHCVMVTRYQGTSADPNKGLPWFYLPNGSKKYVVGYMFGVSQRGESINGWWSDKMSRLVEGGNGERYKDFAHEAGHMMGLYDEEDDGIMKKGNTRGPKAKPTQANIEKVVENICGANVSYFTLPSSPNSRPPHLRSPAAHTPYNPSRPLCA